MGTTERTTEEQHARDLEHIRQNLAGDLVRRNVHLCMSSWVDSLLKAGGGFNEEAHEHYYGEQAPDFDDIRQACAEQSIYVVEWMDDEDRTFQDADGERFDLVAQGGMSDEDAIELRDDAAAGNVSGWYVLEGGELHGNGRVDSFDDADDATRAAAERADVDPQDYIREIYEWWAVDSWFGRKLAERGEHVVDGEHGGSMWGRTCTGQAIALDCVVRAIAAETWPEEWSGEKKSGGE